MAIAIVGFGLTIGGTIFLSISQTVFQHGLVHGIKTRAPSLDPHAFLQNGATEVYAVLASTHQERLLQQVLESYVDGIRVVYWVVMTCGAAALLAARGLTWRSIK